jgi:hypothetical protein
MVIECIMFFCGGFLMAGLLALMLLSAIHRRAVRLTVRRHENSIPVSIVEMRSEKDCLRAEFAVAINRLERIAEQLKFTAAIRLREIEQKAKVIQRLKAELAIKTEVADGFGRELQNTRRTTEATAERERHAIEVEPITALSTKQAEWVRSITEQSLVKAQLQPSRICAASLALAAMTLV